MAFGLTQTDTKTDAAPGTTITFSACSLGATDPNRKIIVAIGVGNQNRFPTNVTLGGANGTQLLTVDDADGCTLAFYVFTNTGSSTADVVATYAVAPSNCAICVFRMVEGNPVPTDTKSDIVASSNALDVSTTIPATGGAIGFVINGGIIGAPFTTTWTNLTEQTDAVLETTVAYTSALALGGGAVTITATMSGNPTSQHGLGVVVFDYLAPAPLDLPGMGASITNIISSSEIGVY